jgi:hypothetical protein
MDGTPHAPAGILASAGRPFTAPLRPSRAQYQRRLSTIRPLAPSNFASFFALVPLAPASSGMVSRYDVDCGRDRSYSTGTVMRRSVVAQTVAQNVPAIPMSPMLADYQAVDSACASSSQSACHGRGREFESRRPRHSGRVPQALDLRRFSAWDS